MSSLTLVALTEELLAAVQQQNMDFVFFFTVFTIHARHVPYHFKTAFHTLTVTLTFSEQTGKQSERLSSAEAFQE